MIRYDICDADDEDVFKKQCRALEKNIPNLIKGNFIEADILYQKYFLDGKQIRVIADYFDGVYVESEIPLEHYFKQ